MTLAIMPTNVRVTVTLPTEVVREIDRLEKSRSKFVLEAVRHELKRRRREDLQRSLRSPHPESEQLAKEGFDEWAGSLPEEDAADLVDLKAGRFPLLCVVPITGTPGEGALYPQLGPGRSGLTKTSYALVDHLRSVDKRRVRRVFGQLAPGELSAVSDGLALFLGFGDRLEPESTPHVQ